MDKSTILILFAFFLGVSADITDDCLDAICQVETGCQPLNCTADDSPCGYYQITMPYYIDCGRPGEDWESCSLNKTCSSNCVRKYMKRYGKYCAGARTPTCKDYARIHYGGPLGCLRKSTKHYWKKVEAALS